MAKDRIEPCIHYVCKGECEENREANYRGYCQRCDKYIPRARKKHKNIKKEKLMKERERDIDY